MSDPTQFREDRRQQRARRIATRIYNSGGMAAVQAAASSIVLDSVCAPGVPTGHQVPEPSAQTLKHIEESYGYAVSEAAEGRTDGAKPRPAPTYRQEAMPEPTSPVIAAPGPGFAAAVADAVRGVLAAMGIKAPEPAPVTHGAPPMNEDR